MIHPLSLQPYLRARCLQLITAKRISRGLTTGDVSLKKQEYKGPHIPSAALSYHWDTLPPTPEQLKHAAQFFEKQPPNFLWSAPKFKTMDFGDSPEVCFLGRSNVGKSSLMNAILGRKIAHTSSKPGRTKCMNAFAIGDDRDNDGTNRLVVLDMPGYGKGGREEWGTQVIKYLTKRKELKRAFLLIDSHHGVKDSDKMIIALFKEQAIPFQIVMSKADKILFDGNRRCSDQAMANKIITLRKTMEGIQKLVQPDREEDSGATGEVFACSSEKWINGKRMGVDGVRFAMLQAAGLEFRPKIKLASPVEIVPFDQIFGNHESQKNSSV
jgi:GTP-binding protein